MPQEKVRQLNISDLIFSDSIIVILHFARKRGPSPRPPKLDLTARFSRREGDYSIASSGLKQIVVGIVTADSQCRDTANVIGRWGQTIRGM